LGFITGILQLIGYVWYLSVPEIEPNPVSWFMFAYGTAILTVLEWDSQAVLAELILPMTCSILAIYVSIRCWVRARKLNPSRWWPEDWWPEDRLEQWSFISDIFITISYVFVWVLASSSFLTTDEKQIAIIAFLLLSNLSTIPSFYPILRETYLYPHKERWQPWMIWSSAYIILGVISFSVASEYWYILITYPIINAVLHFMVGYFALPHRQLKRRVALISA
jgi:hypothetical protein